MRKYLKDLNIVEGMLVSREGELLRVSIQYHIDNVDKIVILLDNYDGESEKIVKEFAKKYPKQVAYYYSTIPIKYISKKEHKIYHRFKRYEGKIRQELLNHIKKEHEQKSIDLLYWFDADEIPTNHFPKTLEKFWESNKKAFRLGYIHMFNGFKMISNDNIRPHCRVFKYQPDLAGYPFKGLAQLIPIKNKEIMSTNERLDIHMSDFDLDYINKRSIYQKRCKAGHKYNELKIWEINKDARDLSSEDFSYIIKENYSIGTIAEYLKLRGIDSDGRSIKYKNLKLNLGCGKNKLDGFVNLDRKEGWKFQDGLSNYYDDSIDAITISHALMYLDDAELKTFLTEAYRVLKVDGIIRIVEDNVGEGGRKKWWSARILTNAKMMREFLEGARFEVYDVKLDETHYIDNSLIQRFHGDPPKTFHMEGIKKYHKDMR